MTSFGPGRRSRFVEILAIARLRQRFPHHCGLARNQNLPPLDGHHSNSDIDRCLRFCSDRYLPQVPRSLPSDPMAL